MSRKPKCWRWTAGGHGATVVAFERVPGGPLYVGVPRKGGGYDRVSLGHTDRDFAMRQAAELAAKRQSGEGRSGPLTVAAMFDLYQRSMAGKQGAQYETETVRVAEAWSRWLGPDFRVERFGVSEWESYCQLRASGELDSKGRIITDPTKREPVGPTGVGRDLKIFRAACRRATVARSGTGFLLAVDPTRGLVIPTEKNPARAVCDAARFDALMAVASQVKMRQGFGPRANTPSYFPTLLRLAYDTGRRISSILALAWPDWHPELGKQGRIHWRHESDKVGRDWMSPVTAEVREELMRLQRERLAVGGLMFPAPNDATKPLEIEVATRWLRKAEKLAKLEHLPRGGWHAFRRGWATSRKHHPIKDIAAAGGWTETSTLLRCYVAVDDETQEQVISSPRRISKMG